LNEFIYEIRERRDFAVDLVTLTPRLSCVTPEAAFYLMVKADDPSERPDERLVMNMAEEAGVLVVHGSGFGCDPDEGYFRMVYLADKAVLVEAFLKIGQFMNAESVSV
jgi:aspartate/methionine/tyrosine aminotransferase